MMCGKTLRDEISNGLLKDRTGVKDVQNHLGETRLRRLGHDILKEWMKQIWYR